MHSATLFSNRTSNGLCLAFGLLATAAAMVVLWQPPVLLAGAAVAVLALSFAENERFLLALIFLQPIDLVSRAIPLGSDAALLLHAFAVAGFFLGRLYRRELRLGEIWRPAATRTSGAFVAAIAVSAVFGLPGLAHEKLRGVYFVAVYFGFYLVLWCWLATEERRRAALRALLSSTILVGVFAVVQTLSQSYTPLYSLFYELDSTRWQSRPTSFLPGPNALAGYLNVILPFALAAYLLSDDRAWKRLTGAAAALGILSLILSESRGGYIAFAATLVLAIWHFAGSWKRRFTLFLAAALLGAACCAALVAWNPAHFGDFAADNSTLSRVILWYTAWKLFVASPVHGIGFGTFSFISGDYLPVVVDMPDGLGVHNIYLELLAESGVLGLASFLAVAGAGIGRAWRQCSSGNWFRHATGFGAAAGLTATLVGGFADHNVLWAPPIAFSFWFWLALVGGTNEMKTTAVKTITVSAAPGSVD